MTSQPSSCAKCGHALYNHEDSELKPARCRYWGCRCRRFRDPALQRVSAQRSHPRVTHTHSKAEQNARSENEASE